MTEMKNTVAFVAAVSGTGKTTLIEAVIKFLKAGGCRVAAVKHAGHAVEVDRRGSDSWRFSRAGSDVTVLAAEGTVSVTRTVSTNGFEVAIEEASGDSDIVLVEGYKEMALPKIELYRSDLSPGLYCRSEAYKDPDLIAVASDVPLDVDVPVLDLNDPEKVGEFIVEWFKGSEQ